MWPNIYQTHIKGLAKNPSLRGKDGRILLDYDPSKSNARKRRYQATKNVTNPDPTQFDIDEFPYASTKQGGASAATNVVPLKENRQHGGYLGSLTIAASMKNGDQFDIILIPDSDKKRPQSSPVRIMPFVNPEFKLKPHTGYPGQALEMVLERVIEKVFGTKVDLPPPIPSPVVAPVPAF